MLFLRGFSESRGTSETQKKPLLQLLSERRWKGRGTRRVMVVMKTPMVVVIMMIGAMVL